MKKRVDDTASTLSPGPAERVPSNDATTTRRLLYCWKACEGISMQVLENLNLKSGFNLVMDERDELLGALREIDAAYRAYSIYDPKAKPHRAIQSARAILAKHAPKDGANKASVGSEPETSTTAK